MENLLEDILLAIIKKVTTFGHEDLLRFEMNSKYHKKLAHEGEVLRALPRNCLWYLTDHWPSEGKCKFMQQISRSEAASHGSDVAKYFELMLKILASDSFSMEEVFPTFKDLFDRKQLADYGRALMNVEGISFFWGFYWTRPLPPGLEYRFTCTSNGTCKGHGRRPNIFCPLPGDDEEYSTTNLFLFCRLDVEIAWFLFHFC